MLSNVRKRLFEVVDKNKKPEPVADRHQVRISLLWWGMVDSNHRRHRQQIYSLSPLATREFPHIQFALGGAGGRTRTPDLLITNQLLYQLSYTSIQCDPSVAPDNMIYYTTLRSVCQAFFQKYFSDRGDLILPKIRHFYNFYHFLPNNCKKCTNHK